MRWVGFVVLCAAALPACGPSAPKQPDGSEGGACFMDGTCDDGLACQGGVCHAAGLPDASTLPRPDARVAADAPRPDARIGADAAPGQPDATPRPDAPPPPPDAPSPPDASVPTTGELSLTWSITLNGSPATCGGTGAVTVQMVVTPSGGGSPMTSRFACTDGAGTTGALAAGSYTVVGHLLDAGDHNLDDANVAGPVTVVAGVTTSAGGVTFAITQSTTGALIFSWDIHVGDAAATCGDVDADSVELDTLTNVGGPTYVDFFLCTAHQGTTLPLPVGNYESVIARLYDQFGEPLAQFALGPATVTPDGETDMGTAHFQIPAVSGRIDVLWDITKGGLVATCEDVGASAARVDAVAHADDTTTTDFFACSDGIGLTDALAPDDYDVTVQLLDSIGNPVGDPVGPTTVTVAGNDSPELDVVFAF